MGEKIETSPPAAQDRSIVLHGASNASRDAEEREDLLTLLGAAQHSRNLVPSFARLQMRRSHGRI